MTDRSPRNKFGRWEKIPVESPAVNKKCSRCGETKDRAEFHASRKKRDGLHAWCKTCNSEWFKSYLSVNRDRVKKRKDETRRLNPEKTRAYSAAYHKSHTAERLAYAKKYSSENYDSILKKSNLRYKSDPLFAVKCRLRSRIRVAFRRKGWLRGRSAQILGCSFIEAKNHLESKFKPGMSWDNRNLWHIDHIIPLASAKTQEDLLILCRYTNLQPLWAKENLQKREKIL